jgi:MoaA/NifB/PqqE/SkfB family radical SAM enzyme
MISTPTPIRIIRETELGRYDTLIDTARYAVDLGNVQKVTTLHHGERTLRPPKEWFEEIYN